MQRLPAVLAMLLLAGMCQTAGAGFILDSIDVGLGSHGPPHQVPPPWAQAPDWVREMVGEVLRLHVAEEFEGLDAFPVQVTGETDADPTMHITKQVENSSGVIWTEYTIELSGTGVTFVAGSAASSHFLTAIDETPNFIRYKAPSAVLPGQTVTFDFDVNVATTGYFGFTLTQTPIPEPATLAFIGLGGIVVLAMRRRRVRP